MQTLRVIGLGAALALAGCDRSSTTSASMGSSTNTVAVDPTEPRQAQPRLQTLKLYLGSEELLVELALTMDQVRTGMMFRTQMPENEGMLFVFANPHRAGFWMKNTVVPLSAAYINPEGVILEIHDLHPHNTNSVMASSERVQYVLETNQGWFKRHNVGVGAVLRTERGTLRETFFRSR